MRLGKLAVLAVIVAGATIGVLTLNDVVPRADLADVVLKTFGSIAVLFAAAFAWRSVRGKPDAMDRTDKPVP